jgi:hypothetical protein
VAVVGRRSRRRGRTAMAGRGGSGSGEGRAHGWQGVAWEGATGPREYVGKVGRR